MRCRKYILSIFVALTLSVIITITGCDSGGGNGSQTENTTNMARFFFDCDLQGLTGKLSMDIEIVSSTGITWGSGPNPEISGVIGTGDYIIYTEGDLTSPTAEYIFTGENNFADFVDLNSSERFRVQWVEEANGLTMIVNPFGPEPTQHSCVVTDSERL